MPEHGPVLILVGALLSLDKQVFGPFTLGRPLMVGLILGTIAGEPGFGLWLGLSSELLWLSSLPLGGQITPNAGLAVSAAFIAWDISGFSGHPPESLASTRFQAPWVVAFLTVFPWAKIMGLIDQLARGLVSPVVARIRADLAQGREPRPFWRNLYGLAATLALSGAFLFAAVLINAQIIKAAASRAPQALLSYLGQLSPLIPFVGLLGAAVFMDAKSFRFYLGGLLAGLAVLSVV